MNATPSSNSFGPVDPSRSKHKRRAVKSFAKNDNRIRIDHQVMAALVEKALRLSFPECHSEKQIADAASPYFRDKYGEPINPRTIQYWLRQDTLPSALHLGTLVQMQPKVFLTAWLGAA